MMTGRLGRVLRLERCQQVPDPARAALVIVGGIQKDPESLIGVCGLNNVPRQAGEPLQSFLDRLERHVRQTRPRALPFVAFGVYSDDEPDD